MTDKISKRLMLTDKNPTLQKFNKLCDLADELGISISFHGHAVTVEDNERDKDLPTLYLEDIEPNHQFSEFPPCTEYKLVYANPVYLEQQQQAFEAAKKKEQEENAARAAQAEKEAEERLVRMEAQKRAEDLRQLAALKAKYPDG